MKDASRSSDPSRAIGDQRRRLLRHHVPLALASAVVLVLFMTLPRFDANVYAHADIFSGAFPQQREQRGEDGSMSHGGGEEGPSAEGEHGQGESPSAEGEHGGDQGPSAEGEHGRGQSPSAEGEQSGDQTSSSDERPSDSFLGLTNRGFTVATGYVATGLLGFTLLIGPANLLLRKRNPVSSYLRRDVGAWTAVFSVVHVIYGLQVHRRLSDFLNYFVAPDGSPLTNSFGLANWTGLAALAIVVGLLYRSEGRNGHARQLALPLTTEQDMPAGAGFELRPLTDWDRMAADYSILGLSPTHHPMAFLRSRLHEGVVPSRMLQSLPDGSPVEVAGLVVCRQRPGTAKGFVFLVLEDEFGLVNVVVKPALHDRQRSLVRTEPFIIVQGKLQRRDGTVNVIAERFTPLRAKGAPAPEAHNFG